MASPHTFSDPIRVHDVAFYNWVGGLRVDYGYMGGLLSVERNNFPILRTYAGPTRVVASITHLLVSLGWIDGSTAAEMRANASDNFAVLPLPVATLQRTSEPSVEVEYSGVPKLLSTAVLDDATGQYERHRYPSVFQTGYSLTLWSLKRYTMAFMQEWLMGQLGAIGSYPTEIRIPVVHPDPWGVKYQALRFESMTDLSELEGEDPPFRRTELSFQLRTFVFHPLGSAAGETYGSGRLHLVNTLGVGTQFSSDRDGVSDDPDALADDVAASVLRSGNLFRFYTPRASVPTLWLKTGATATVAEGVLGHTGGPSKESLRVGVTEVTDEVDVSNWLVNLDASGRAILSVQFYYRATDAVDLVLSQRPGTDSPESWAVARVLPLAAASAWTVEHRFFLLTDPIYSLTVRGLGAASVMDLDALDIRHHATRTPIAISGSVAGGGVTTYNWAGLASRQYLIVLALTPGAGATEHSVVARDDAVAPDYTMTQAVREDQQGAVWLLQPKGDTMSLVVPDGLVVAEAFLQVYEGGYLGNAS